MGQSPGLKDSAAGVSEEVAVLRHELANVIDGLSGMTRLLRSSGLGPDQSCWLDAIEGSAEQLRHLVRGVDRECTRRPPGTQIRTNGPCLIERAVVAHAPVADAKGLRLMLAFDPDLPDHWNCDGPTLRQLLDNLLGNALKFTDRGDVMLGVRAEPGGSLRIEVRDTGPGIPGKDISRIFQVRERGSNGKGRPGSGLGLPLCRRIVGDLGGEIEYRPGQGGGSVFEVRLPGVLGADRGPPRKPAALNSVYCVLDLDARLKQSVASCLDRLGVAWRGHGVADSESGADRLVIGVEEASRRAGDPWAGIRLSPLGGARSAQSEQLRPPVLESALERVLLGQVLRWRWRRISPGGTRG